MSPLRARSEITCTFGSPASGALRCCESLVWQSHTARFTPSIASRIRRAQCTTYSRANPKCRRWKIPGLNAVGYWGQSPITHLARDCSGTSAARKSLLAKRWGIDTSTRRVFGAAANNLTQTRHCSSPCMKISFGRSMPIKTILLFFFSPSAQAGPRSLPINWCTPWKITLRSVPSMFSTPL